MTVLRSSVLVVDEYLNTKFPVRRAETPARSDRPDNNKTVLGLSENQHPSDKHEQLALMLF